MILNEDYSQFEGWKLYFWKLQNSSSQFFIFIFSRKSRDPVQQRKLLNAANGKKKKKKNSQNHYFSLSLKCLFAIFKSEKSSLIFLACQYINLSCNKNNTLAFIRQLLSTASNIDAASVYKINVRKKCLIILERVNTFLGIVHPVALSPKWTAVASDNWRFNLTAQKVSSGCALNSFVFGVNVYIYTVTINWYIFPQILFIQ